MSRLKDMYKNEIVDAMIKKFGYKNIMEVPKLDKIVVNMGVGEAKDNAKVLDAAVADMELITGQKAVTTKAKNSIANFKIREGMPIGCKVTLRGEKMYEFADRLINLALPRVRDFRGVNPNAFDGRGNYALGIKEQLIFPEVEYDKVDKVRGMDVIFVTTAKTDEEASPCPSEKSSLSSSGRTLSPSPSTSCSRNCSSPLRICSISFSIFFSMYFRSFPGAVQASVPCCL